MKSPLLLVIDQGTTSTRAAIYDSANFKEIASVSQEITQYYPQPGWVEHDPEEIWKSVGSVVKQALESQHISPTLIAGIGITNQRETIVLWERVTGKPQGRAIVWQDRRTTDYCREHAADQLWLQERTGLMLDPYFSATKIRWLLEQSPDLRRRAERGEILAGTIDSFLISRLTGLRVHATDVTNASRTLLFHLRDLKWDDELCRYFQIPSSMLPEVKLSAADYGATQGLDFLPDGIRIFGVAGDQQAALFGHTAFESGEGKCTYGTGAFYLLHTGTQPCVSKHRLISTLAAMTTAQPKYALEGSVFVAGAAVQWLRDGLEIIAQSSDIERVMTRTNLEEPIIFVPAFTGLGSPYWIPEARGTIFGITRGTTAADLARATIEGVAFQVADLIEAAQHDIGRALGELHVDGGMSRNHTFLQYQANVLALPVVRSPYTESTALGAALLASLGTGIYSHESELRNLIQPAHRFEPMLPAAEVVRRRAQWQRAVQAVIGYYS